jgi:hypothetical protein
VFDVALFLSKGIVELGSKWRCNVYGTSSFALEKFLENRENRGFFESGQEKVKKLKEQIGWMTRYISVEPCAISKDQALPLYTPELYVTMYGSNSIYSIKPWSLRICTDFETFDCDLWSKAVKAKTLELLQLTKEDFFSDDDNFHLLDACMMELKRQGGLTPDIVEAIPPELFSSCQLMNPEIVSEFQEILTAEQIASVSLQNFESINLDKLSDGQLSNVTPEQLQTLGRYGYTPLDPEEMRQLKERLNLEQRAAVEYAERRCKKTEQLFTMMEVGSDQEEIIKLAQDINFKQKKNEEDLLYAACRRGVFDVALFLSKGIVDLGREWIDPMYKTSPENLRKILEEYKERGLSVSNLEKVEKLEEQIDEMEEYVYNSKIFVKDI